MRPEDETPMGATHTTLVDPHGRPARARDINCPRCGAGPDRRVPSSGFGTEVHDLCGSCGYAFDGERTV